MKFKRYMKESVEPVSKLTLTIDEEYENPSVVRDQLDSFYGPIEKLIKDKKFDEAKSELDNLEKDLNEFESENNKKRLFKFPQFMIDGQRKKLASLRSQIPTNESIEDMDKRCEKCNTLLNDQGTCPKCDDGEEDYGDELKEELSNKEKLKRAYPELNFSNDLEEECANEELSNTEKLLRAYPELNFDKTPLTEGTGADTTHAIKDAMDQLAKNDKYTWAKTASDVVNVIPDNFADELFDTIKTKLANIKINHADKRKIVDAVGDGLSEESVEDKDTLGAILDMIDITQWAKKSPEVIKGIVLVILGIVAVIEPTPIVEIIMSVITLIPASVVANIASILSVISNPASAAIAVANKVHDTKTESLDFEELSVREKLKRAYPELNFDVKIDEGLYDAAADSNNWYDDDYSVDDVEEDRRHAALYGGDRTYCNCGKKLVRTDWGSYCPDCDPETAEEEHLRMIDDDMDEGFIGWHNNS